MCKLTLVAFALVLAQASLCKAQLRNSSVCSLWDLYELVLPVQVADLEWLGTDPLAGTVLEGRVTPPAPGRGVRVQGFYDGVGSFKLRVYCQWPGMYSVVTNSVLQRLHNVHVTFTVSTRAASKAIGKLRHHRDDPHQFSTDSGQWFLHIGDTGYRFLIPSEPMWRQYIDEAATLQQATKVRAWLASGRHAVQEAVTGTPGRMNVRFWDVVESRLRYALDRYPWVQVQVILFGEDAAALLVAATRPSSVWAYLPVYAQARFSSFANVHWCVINDVNSMGPVQAVGAAMHAREPWGTLITSHQRRRTGYSFAEATWSGIVTLQTLDAVNGAEVAQYRARQRFPVVLDEDRYEMYKAPSAGTVQDWFRMFFWSAVVTGGHATYGGIQTWLPYSASSATTGVRGYGTLVAGKVLRGGARDLKHIHSFFKDGPVKSMVNFLPGSQVQCGDVPARALCAFRSAWAVFYLKQAANVTVRPSGGRRHKVHEFNPVRGAFSAVKSATGDLVVLQCSSTPDCVIVVHSAA